MDKGITRVITQEQYKELLARTRGGRQTSPKASEHNASETLSSAEVQRQGKAETLANAETHAQVEAGALSNAEVQAQRKAETPSKAESRTQRGSGGPRKAEVARSQEAMELGLKIWELRKAGYNRLEIVERLEIPLKVIDDCLREFESRIGMEAGRAMEHYRVLDNERIEDLLKYWLPIATGGPIRIEKIRAGEVFGEADFDRPLKASYFVLQAIERRLKIMAASRPEAGKDNHGQTNVTLWLQSVLPSLEKIVHEVDDNAAANGQERLGGKPSGKARLG